MLTWSGIFWLYLQREINEDSQQLARLCCPAWWWRNVTRCSVCTFDDGIFNSVSFIYISNVHFDWRAHEEDHLALSLAQQKSKTPSINSVTENSWLATAIRFKDHFTCETMLIGKGIVRPIKHRQSSSHPLLSPQKTLVWGREEELQNMAKSTRMLQNIFVRHHT